MPGLSANQKTQQMNDLNYLWLLAEIAVLKHLRCFLSLNFLAFFSLYNQKRKPRDAFTPQSQCVCKCLINGAACFELVPRPAGRLWRVRAMFCYGINSPLNVVAAEGVKGNYTHFKRIINRFDSNRLHTCVLKHTTMYRSLHNTWSKILEINIGNEQLTTNHSH